MRRRGILLGVAALTMATGSIVVSAFADARLIPPTENPVYVFPAPNPSATFSPATARFLASSGIHFVIPRVPAGFPPVTGEVAARAAASHFPVGATPRIDGMALIAIRGKSISPLRAGMIVWAISFKPNGGKAGRSLIAFVNAARPLPLGALAGRWR